MTPDERRSHSSERFDAAGTQRDLHTAAEREDWEAWSHIATQLERPMPGLLPANFATRVQRAAARARFWQEAVLVLKVGSFTGLVLTLVFAQALGFHWWTKLLSVLQPSTASAILGDLAATSTAALSRLVPVAPRVIRAWAFLPTILCAAAALALAAELALFRYLRVGPFQRKASLSSTRHPHEPL